MQGVDILKICLMVAFFLEVTIFGNVVSSLECFSNPLVMDTAMTFSGTLFLSIAMIDVIPQAISNFNQYLNTHSGYQSSLHQGKLPLTMIIAITTMLLIMWLDKIVMGHSHDHQYQISFVAGPKRSQHDAKSVVLRDSPELPGSQQNYQIPDSERPRIKSQPVLSISNKEQLNQHKNHNHQQEKGLTSENKEQQQNPWRPFILQIGMGIHAFFETLAVGLQKNTISVISLATAILVHKWAQGLTLGLMYRKQGYGGKTAILMVIVQGLINILGLFTGTMLMGQGNFIMAFFMSMSAGTFFYISLGEVLQQQLKSFSKLKMFMMMAANIFIILIVWFQKSSQNQQNQKL